MDFNSYAVKAKYKDKTKDELLDIKEQIEIDLEADLSRGDIRILEKEINHINQTINLMETTSAGDVAAAATNMLAPCTGKPDCDCQKCMLLRDDKTAKKLAESTGFGSFFGA